ncbi:MAG: choice-of-anchor D domain-containing protein, partial [bacterium]
FSNNAALVALGATNPLAVATTDADGNYRAVVGFNWGGTVTPFAKGYSDLIFAPAQRSYTNVVEDVVATNLTRFVYTPSLVILGTDTPNAIDFGAVQVGRSASHTVVLKNNGKTACNVMGAAPSAYYFMALPGAYILNPGATGVVNVTFTPPASGVFTGRVDWATSPEPFGGAPRILVQGAGLEIVDVLYYSGDVNFGTLFVGQSDTHTITLYNMSALALKVSGKWSNGTDFSTKGLPATIPSGGSANFTMTFAPKTSKDYGGAMLVLSAKGLPTTATLSPISTVLSDVAGTWTAKINKQNYTLYLKQAGAIVDGVMVCAENPLINDQYVASFSMGALAGALWNTGAPVGSLPLSVAKKKMTGSITRTGVGTGLAASWKQSSTTVPASVIFPPRPALVAKPAAATGAGILAVPGSSPADALRVTLLDLAPAAMLPEDSELLVVILQDGRPVAVSPALDRYNLSWLLQTRIEAEGADADANGLPDLLEAALGVPLQDGAELLIVRKSDGQAVPEAPYSGTVVEGSPVPFSDLPATWSLKTAK